MQQKLSINYLYDFYIHNLFPARNIIHCQVASAQQETSRMELKDTIHVLDFLMPKALGILDLVDIS